MTIRPVDSAPPAISMVMAAVLRFGLLKSIAVANDEITRGADSAEYVAAGRGRVATEALRRAYQSLVG